MNQIIKRVVILSPGRKYGEKNCDSLTNYDKYKPGSIQHVGVELKTVLELLVIESCVYIISRVVCYFCYIFCD